MLFWICFVKNIVEGNHRIITVNSSFSERSDLKMFSIHTKMKSRRFQISLVWRMFSWQISVDCRLDFEKRLRFQILLLRVDASSDINSIRAGSHLNFQWLVSLVDSALVDFLYSCHSLISDYCSIFLQKQGKHLNALSGFLAVTFTKVINSSNNMNNLCVTVFHLISSRRFCNKLLNHSKTTSRNEVQ